MNVEITLTTIVEKEISDLKTVVFIWNKNRNRTVGLLKQSVKLGDHLDNKDIFLTYMQDIMRASIVFLHSSLETALREIVRLKLKYDGDLSSIPFSEVPGYKNKKDKFALVELVKYREKTINDIIEMSVDNHLSNVSFNSTSDIVSMFKQIGLPTKTLEKHFAVLDKIMNRRHDIVHEGDFTNKSLNPINANEVVSWIAAAEDFFLEVLNIITSDVYLKKIEKALTENSLPYEKSELSKTIKISVDIN